MGPLDVFILSWDWCCCGHDFAVSYNEKQAREWFRVATDDYMELTEKQFASMRDNGDNVVQLWRIDCGGEKHLLSQDED
jgi:hypothetical protein